MENRIVIFSTANEQTAIITRDHLIAEGIDVLLLDQKDHVSEVVGSFELHVHPEDEAKAKAIIAQNGE